MTKKHARHPLSAAMGEMEPDAFITLQDSIGSVGVMEPIKMFEGKVLDGWNRYQAATGLGVDCPEEPFEGDYNQAAEFVWAKHGARRNWDKAQRALAQAELTRLRGKTAPGAVVPTAEEDAAQANVSLRTMEQARVVARRAAPEVKRQVMAGDLSLKKAEQIARLPRPEQRQAVQRQQPAAWKPAIAPKPQVGASKEALDDMKEALATLSEENDRLTARLAVHFMEGTDEEKGAYAQLLEELRADNHKLRAELNAVKATNGELMRERNEMLTQLKMYRNQLVKRA